MKKQTAEKILELNKDFYANIAQHFSKTRQYAWRGWEKVAVHIERLLTATDNETLNINVADLGCGNGRFLIFLQEKFPKWNIKYSGWDSNRILLDVAKKDSKKNAESLGIQKHSSNFIEEDVLANINTVRGKYNLVTAFGLAHHIPSREMRANWFDTIFRLVDKQGLLVVTFWNYSKDARSENAVRSIKTPSVEINEAEIEVGDYFLGWDKKPNVYRFIHEYSTDELEGIIGAAKTRGLTLIDTFDSDGRSQNLNKYCIFKR